MLFLSEEKYKKRLERIKKSNLNKKRRQKLRNEKTKYKKHKQLPSTSKLVLIGAVILCLEIIIFAEYAMVKTGDLSGLYAIVGIAATLASVVLGYFFKSKAENTEGGIVYETALKSFYEPQESQSPEIIEDEEVLG